MRGLPVALCLVSGGAQLLGAQAADSARAAIIFRDVPVATALDKLVAVTGINLMYDPEVLGKQRVFCQSKGDSPEALLRCIVRDAGLDFYRLSSGTYVVIAAANAAPRFASLVGLVVDSASGAPVTEALVRLTDATGTHAVSSAGTLRVTRLLPGRHRVSIRALGYRPLVTDLDVPPNGQLQQQWRLVRQAPVLTPLLVQGISAPTGVGASSQVPDSVAGAMHTPDAVVRGASSELGVAQRALIGDLHIQGSDAGEHQFRLDGVPVFDPVSLGRLFGSFSPLAIQRVTVRKAGFDVAGGSYTAGVLDLEHAIGHDAGLRLTADPYAVNGRLMSGWQLGSVRGQGMLAARKSLWDLQPNAPLARTLRDWTRIDRPVLDRLDAAVARLPAAAAFETTNIHTHLAFTDLHAAARAQLGAFRTVSASVYSGRNSAGSLLESEVALPTPQRLTSRDDYAWQTLAAQLRLDWLPDARSSTVTRIRVSRHALHHQQESRLGLDTAGLEPPHERNGVREIALESTWQRFFGEGARLDVGGEVARTGSEMTMANRVFRPMTQATTASRATGWLSWHQPLGKAVTLEAGTRVTWSPARAQAWAEPRFAIVGDRPTVRWRVAGGAYRQFVAQFDLPAIGASPLVGSMRFWLPVDANLAPPRAWHLAGEGVWVFGAWEVRTELFGKWQPEIRAIDFAALVLPLDGPAPEGNVIADARGYVMGGGVRASRALGRWRIQAGYDATHARRTFPSRFGGRSQPPPWNEPHRAMATADMDAVAGLSLSLRTRAVWGRSWGLRQVYYDVLSVAPSPAAAPIGHPGDDRLPALIEGDAGIQWRGRIGTVPVRLGATMLNALGRRNVVDRWLVTGAGTTNGSAALRDRPLLGRQLLLTLGVG